MNTVFLPMPTFARPSENTEKRFPFHRPSLYTFEYIHRRFPTFVERLTILPNLEKHCIHFDIFKIIRTYCENQMVHREAYQHLRMDDPKAYEQEFMAHMDFIQGLYNLYRFRLFVTSLLTYAHTHMPIHKEYFTVTARGGSTLTYAQLLQEEALHQRHLMTQYMRVYDFASVLLDVSPRVWSRYMHSLFPSTWKTHNHGYQLANGILSLLKCIHTQLNLHLSSARSCTKYVQIEDGSCMSMNSARVSEQEQCIYYWIERLKDVLSVQDM